MPVEDLATLADTSAVTLVAAMTTDAWTVIRSGIARLFGHDGPEREHEVKIQLDSNAQLVRRSDDEDQARRSLLGLWRLEFEQFLNRHPGSADDLQALMDRARESLPQGQRSWVITVTAYDHGLSVGVHQGNVIIYGRESPGFISQPGPASAERGAES